MTTPTPTKRLNLSLRKRDEVTRETLNDSLILEALDQPFPDLHKLSYTIRGKYERPDLPLWLTVHFDVQSYRNLWGDIVVALLRVQKTLRHSPRHARLDQRFLHVPLPPSVYGPKHLSPPPS